MRSRMDGTGSISRRGDALDLVIRFGGKQHRRATGLRVGQEGEAQALLEEVLQKLAVPAPNVRPSRRHVPGGAVIERKGRIGAVLIGCTGLTRFYPFPTVEQAEDHLASFTVPTRHPPPPPAECGAHPALSGLALREACFAMGEACGVYVLTLGSDAIYVGQSREIRGRLGEHMKTKAFDRAFYAEVEASYLDIAERTLAQHLGPRLNIRKWQPVPADQNETWLKRLGILPASDLPGRVEG